MKQDLKDKNYSRECKRIFTNILSPKTEYYFTFLSIPRCQKREVMSINEYESAS